MMLEQNKKQDNQVVPSGYKLTEAGIIPDTWEVKTINDVATFSGGAQPSKEFFSSKPKKGYIRLIQIRDYKTSEYETYIPEILAKKKCTENDIMIGRYGPPIFQILRGIQGAYNVALIKAVPTTMIEKEYLYYFLKTNKLFVLMDGLSQRSSGQTGIELPALKSYPVPLPTKLEQTAIANVLSDTDTLIIKLEKLIVKKQAIKTATMQQLLTGHTRLPLFAKRPDGTLKSYKFSELGRIPEDWEVHPLGYLLNDSPRYGINAPAVKLGRNIPVYIRITDISDNGYFRPTEKVGVNSPLSDSYILQEGDIVLARTGASVGKSYLYKPEDGTLVYAGFLIKITPDQRSLNSKFLFQFLQTQQYWNWIATNSMRSGQPGVNGNEFASLPIPVPPKKEQTAIASILSDMDAELEALEQKLSKIRDIKQGMMQQLLTGRIRLPLDHQP
ncbi:restriction endonuclease subunit S [Rahnella ecdela]|uniref:Restriction endonuclease subunit S n=1 Tax=Rahnella ecdela TaxID=2816250 RepID=A0ABS6LCR4_9GAMM|nr:restriction endonuclease subunit S [Rahnella ecdela]MBU9844655.1 restriction endonuclease subunit S [Rahnella ecdela]